MFDLYEFLEDCPDIADAIAEAHSAIEAQGDGS